MTKKSKQHMNVELSGDLESLEPPEGSRLDVILITNEKPRSNDNAAEILAEIAALPLEGASDSFSGRDHDSILYSKEPPA